MLQAVNSHILISKLSFIFAEHLMEQFSCFGGTLYNSLFWISNTVFIIRVLFCRQDFVDAPLTIPACFTKNLNIDWSEYQVNTRYS